MHSKIAGLHNSRWAVPPIPRRSATLLTGSWTAKTPSSSKSVVNEDEVLPAEESDYPKMDSSPTNLLRGIEPKLLMIGSCSSTYQLGKVIIKVPRIDEEAEMTQDNAKAAKTEANVYRILGLHDRIANCLYVSPTNDLILLEFYSHGTLKDYVAIHGLTQLLKWANQMIERVQYIHSKGVRHSDIRLNQWLLDHGMNARLGDFNSSGYDECSVLDLPGQKAIGIEDPNHFMPRDSCEDNSVRSDLFAFGSALYEIEYGRVPFTDEDDETVTQRFARRQFPSVSNLTLGRIISGSWKGEFESATAMLQSARPLCSFTDATGQP